MWSRFPYFVKTRICVNVSTDNGLPRQCSVEESACQRRRLWRHKRHEFNSWVGKILWRRKWLPTPVFLPGKFHGERRLAGCSPWGHKELDMIECTRMYTHIFTGQCWFFFSCRKKKYFHSLLFLRFLSPAVRLAFSFQGHK